MTKNHWFHSTVAFTAIMHIVNYKIFIELKYWNKLSIFITIFSLIFYYACVLVLNTSSLAFIFNTELTNIFLDMFRYFKSWIVIIALPLVAIMPDLFMNWIRYNFFSSPADVIFANQQIFREMNRDEKKGPVTARSKDKAYAIVTNRKESHEELDEPKSKDMHSSTDNNNNSHSLKKSSDGKTPEHDPSDSRHYLQASNTVAIPTEINDRKKKLPGGISNKNLSSQ
jgi:hypothetical protein